jgi:hypothetical protein
MDPIHPPAVVRAAADLRILAAEINAAHKAGEETTRHGLEHFRAAGEALLKAKAQVGHGGWTAWLGQHIRFSQRTATDYMRLAREWPKLAAAANLRDALRLLTEEGDEPDDEPEPPDQDPAAEATGEQGPNHEAENDPEPESTADSPEPPLPDRIRPYFEGAGLFDQAARKADELSNLLRQVEETPAYKKATDGRPHTWYSNTVRTAGRTTRLLKPVRPCPHGCGAVEPSLDSDPCPACQGKGYQTAEDIEMAEAAK